MNIDKIKNEIRQLINSQTSIISSNQSFKQYLERCQRRGINNEEKVVQPFTISFLKILNYINQHNLVIEESQKGNKPDFYSSNFIFECKSSKYKNFSEALDSTESPEEQLKRYLKSKEFNRKFGILFSLDRLHVYKLIDGELEPIPSLSFSIIDIFSDKPSHLENFISKFYISPISFEKKIEIIGNVEKKDLIPINPPTFNKILKSLIKDIMIELQSEFVKLNKNDDETKLIQNKVCQIKKQMDLKSTSEAEIEFISQTSYIILARILLTKCWEDLRLIDPPNTYNGGFKEILEDYYENISEIYKRALNKSQDIYYLFNPNNPYLLLQLSENLIIDIFFQICKYDFNTLDYDMLGYIYEDYLDLEHRKKYGQYYTPPYIVNLILDRVGYKESVRKLLDSTILDPASGSGTFLLNAVRRVISSWKDGNDHTLDYKNVIENNIFGSELMLFPYLISEINILIQISSLLINILNMKKKLNVFHVFPNNSFNLIDKLIIQRIANIPEDEIRGNNIIDSAVMDRKEQKLKNIQYENNLDYVVGNPPYVANDTNPELFREMREIFTFCNETYHNKMDLFYWFIILGILKLKPGGKLGYITTRYWIDKGEKTGVETLKKYILDNCYLREVVDLRNVNVFISATGQENIIFVLEKKGNNIEDKAIKIFKIQPRLEKYECILKNCIFDHKYCKNDQEYLECLCKRESKWKELLVNPQLPLSNYIKAFISARKTSDLKYNRSWDIFSPSEGIIKDILDGILSSCTNDNEKIDAFGNTLIERDVIKYIKDFFVLRVGVLTTVDKIFILKPDIYTLQHNDFLIKMETTIDLKRSEKEKIIEKKGGMIDSEGYIWLKISNNEKRRFFNLYKTPSVYPHGIDTSKFIGFLIFFEDEKEYSNCPVLVYYLKQYKDIIEKKLGEYKELTPSRPNKWITLRRSATITLPNRKKRDLYSYYLKEPKIFYNYRVGNENIFGFTDKHMVAATDMYFFHKYGENINIYYVLAYLNSKVISFYFKERPIELNRQKTNVENDIPIFIPRNENEITLQKIIIKLERKLTKKLQRLEKLYRSSGFHFNIKKRSEQDITINLQKLLENIHLETIIDLSYHIKNKGEIGEINRNDFPFLIYNPRDKEKLEDFKEIIGENEVIFQFKSLYLYVSTPFYERVKVALESYFLFADSPNFSGCMNLKLPNKKVLKIIEVKKELLLNHISPLTSEERVIIEDIIENILEKNIIQNLNFISSISKIIYFIDVTFIEMMIPDYKEEILEY